jgi:hypothetical protein
MAKLITDYVAIKDRTGHNSKAKANVSCRSRTNWAYNAKLAKKRSKCVVYRPDSGV